MRLSDIHWDSDRFTITSTKTKKYGKGTQVCPIFPELRPFLEDALAVAADGQRWVVPLLGGREVDDQGERLITRGMQPLVMGRNDSQGSQQTAINVDDNARISEIVDEVENRLDVPPGRTASGCMLAGERTWRTRR